MEGLFPQQKAGMTSIFAKISETTRNTTASNVNNLNSQTDKIIVRGKEIEYNRKDKIFDLAAPTSKKCSIRD